jgi:EAL domain-containing protein (putative c-di-GMP-specific phosphodiesterase class I)/FixJ family two-component response regulator
MLLVIDDDAQFALDLVDRLKLNGFQSAWAAGAHVGIAQAIALRPTVILCSLWMLDMNGCDVLEILRQNPDTEAIPIIFLAPDYSVAALNQSMALGVDAYLTKSCLFQDLLDTVLVQVKRSLQVQAPVREKIPSHAAESLTEVSMLEAAIAPTLVKQPDEVKAFQQALTSTEFQIEYQPQINVVTNRMVGIEALVRWQHPQQGRLLPAQFIPFAEETHLIEALGEWVLMQACSDFVQWQALRPDSLKLAVNVSFQQLEAANFETTIDRVLLETGVKPENLMLELNETAPLQDLRRTIATLRRLQKLGIKIALDDFGTDYSSLSLIQQLSPDQIKIDQAFVRQIDRSPCSRAIVKSIIDLAESLKIELVAEGVETIEQLESLFQQGCHVIQGNLWSPALPVIEIPAWL